jgi:Protein of unknown function (DUF4242)
MALRKFIVERDLPEIEILQRKQLGEAVAKINNMLRELGPNTEWVESYAADNHTFSVYLAENEYVLRKQAEISGFPATKISEISANSMVGTISVVRGTTADESSIEPRLFFSSGEGSFRVYEDGPVGVAELLRKEGDQLLRIQGKKIGELLAVDEVEVVGTLRKHIRPAVGVQPWVVLLCRFADSPGSPPESKAWFENLISASHPGLRHFFKDISYGALDTTIDVLVWRTLPGKRADYPNDEGDLLPACTDLYPEVDFTTYYGVIMVVDQNLNNAAGLGSGREATIHGHKQFWGLVWLGTSGWRQPRIWAQEMGHTYGLKHTLVLSSPILRSGWDFMGTVTTCAQTFQGGCLPQHTTAYHKDRLGWIDDNRSMNVSTTALELRIASLSNPDDNGLLYAEINIPGETERYYSVEARHRSGYDQNLPGTAPSSSIVIHEIDQTRNPESYTVDHGANDTNGLGGAWVVGETFVGDNVLIEVLQAAGNGFDVRITYPPRPPIVRLEYAGCFFGSVRFVPSWSAQTGDVVTSIDAEFRYASSPNWVSLSGPTVISANSNQRVYLRARACNAVGCSSYAGVSAKQKCTAHPL